MVSVTVEDLRKGAEATEVVGLDSWQVLGSLYVHGRMATYAQSPKQQKQQADLVSVCTKIAVALATEGLYRLFDLLFNIFMRKGLPQVAVSTPPKAHNHRHYHKNPAELDWRPSVVKYLISNHTRPRLLLPYSLIQAICHRHHHH